MECQFYLLMRSFNSRAAPSKFVPLSLMTVCGLPGLCMNRVIAIILSSVSIPFNTSRYAALVTKHMNKQHQYFTGLLITVTSSGPKCSTTVFWKGDTLPSNHSFDKLAMLEKFACTARLLQLIHLVLMPFNAFRISYVKKPKSCLTRLLTYSIPL